MTTSAILLDIEGTTTSIRFVYDTLFPFVRSHVGPFLAAEWEAQAVQDDISALRDQALHDHAEGVMAAPLIGAGAEAEVRGATVANVLWQMDSDRKTTGLKALQGKIWKQGYASGELLGHVYEDVAPAFRAWRAASVPIYIYSSGSVAAQKLLFRHSVEGDLTPMLAGYFDTTSGPKKVAKSYETIAAAIGCRPAEVLFATDSLDEALASTAAGVASVLSIRPGNAELPGHSFRTVSSLAELHPAG